MKLSWRIMQLLLFLNFCSYADVYTSSVPHIFFHQHILYFAEELYMSPVETQCQTINYHIFDEESDTTLFSDDEMARLREYLNRSILNTFYTHLILTVSGIYDRWYASPVACSERRHSLMRATLDWSGRSLTARTRKGSSRERTCKIAFIN